MIGKNVMKNEFIIKKMRGLINNVIGPSKSNTHSNALKRSRSALKRSLSIHALSLAVMADTVMSEISLLERCYTLPAPLSLWDLFPLERSYAVPVPLNEVALVIPLLSPVCSLSEEIIPLLTPVCSLE
jgi:hypothetical protein